MREDERLPARGVEVGDEDLRLPRAAAEQYNRLRPFGFLLLIVLLLIVPLLFPQLGIVQRVVLPPVEWLSGLYMQLAGAVAGR